MGSDFYDSTILFSRSISRLAVSLACTRSLSRASKVASVANPMLKRDACLDDLAENRVGLLLLFGGGRKKII